MSPFRLDFDITALTASTKTSSKFSRVWAEHSSSLYALILDFTFLASFVSTAVMLDSFRSDFVPMLLQRYLQNVRFGNNYGCTLCYSFLILYYITKYTNKNQSSIRAMPFYFRIPFFNYIIEWSRVFYRITNDETIRLKLTKKKLLVHWVFRDGY